VETGGQDSGLRLAELLAAFSLTSREGHRRVPGRRRRGRVGPPDAHVPRQGSGQAGHRRHRAKALSADSLIGGAELQGTVPMWAWIGDEAATTFSY
jgi:hypothetical protein